MESKKESLFCDCSPVRWGLELDAVDDVNYDCLVDDSLVCSFLGLKSAV